MKTTEDPILAFARDFSANDSAIVQRVEGFLADPPSDLPTIGFYSYEDADPRVRVHLATVALLEDEGRIEGVEDKYVTEILARWQEAGLLDLDALPATARSVFGPLVRGVDDDEEALQLRERLWRDYAQATRELEGHFAANGRVLLSIDATDGDTMFFAFAAPEIGERWRDRALSDHVGYRAGVRSPLWDRFWDHLSYSGGVALVGEGREGYPPGTRLREEAIPFAE